MNNLINRKALCDYALNQKDKSVTPNDIMRFPSAQPEQRWIPCSERLPKVGQDILMSVGGMYTAEGCLREDGDWAQFRWDTIQRKDMVGAWMPLPKPFEGGVKIDAQEGATSDMISR